MKIKRIGVRYVISLDGGRYYISHQMSLNGGVATLGTISEWIGARWFHNHDDAEAVAKELRKSGYDAQVINIDGVWPEVKDGTD
jgi:hypothetical protein